jgi:hypothetical protein
MKIQMRVATLLASLTTFSLVPIASAQEAAPPTTPETAPAAGASVEASTTGASAEVAAEAPAAQEPAADAQASGSSDAPASEAAAAEAPSALGGLVGLLPSTAFPEPYVRGIPGGSLAFTMHGHQWPYLPRVAGQPALFFGVSGSAWVDTSYGSLKAGQANISNQKRLSNQGRAVLRFSPTYNLASDWFVQGQVEFVAKGDQQVRNNNIGGIDDLYIRVGKWKWFDITVGRFQGWEVYHLGMGLDLNTLERKGALLEDASKKPPGLYGADAYWDRGDLGLGSYAAHIYITDFLRTELLTQVGSSGTGNQVAFRPAAILDLGVVKAKIAYEWGRDSAQAVEAKTEVTRRGIGGGVQFVLTPWLEGGVNAAIAYIDTLDKFGAYVGPSSTTTLSYGGFLNGSPLEKLVLGVGANWTSGENEVKNAIAGDKNLGKSDLSTHFQGFASVQYNVLDRLYVKLVGSRSSFHFQDRTHAMPLVFTDGLWGARLRVMYLF